MPNDPIGPVGKPMGNSRMNTNTLELEENDVVVDPPVKTLSICLINPKFEPSYWGFDYALPLYPGSVKCTMVTGSLPHLAALTPDHDVTLLDENVEAIDFDTLSQFDLVGVTGMNVQKDRMREILLELRERKIFTVVGGAYASVDEEFFDG